MEAVCPSKSVGNYMCSVKNLGTKSSKVTDTLCLSNEEHKPLSIANNGENGDIEQRSTSLQAINYLRGDDKCNKVARKDGSFKEEISKFTHDHELVTAGAISAPESAMVLNSMSLKKVFDKIDDFDKKLKSV